MNNTARLLLVLSLWLWPSAVSAQTTATITTKTCTLTMSATKGPDGTTSGWSVQFKRGSVNHGQSDSTAPYGPRSATVDAGSYGLTAVWTKSAQATVETIGTASCQGGLVVVAPPPPPPPAEVCGDGIDNDGDGAIDEGCPVQPPPTGTASPDGTAVPPSSSITDSTGAAWTLGAELNGVPGVRYVMRDGQWTPTYGVSLLYSGGAVYLFGADLVWYRWDAATSAWVRHGATRPGSAPLPTGARTEPRTLLFTPDPAEYDAIVASFTLKITDSAGTLAQQVPLGKPALTADGDVSMPVTLTLTPGVVYRAAVAACASVCGAYSAEASFVF